MAVVIETTLGDFTVDLFTEERPRTSLNFLKLCKIKYYNFCLFHTVQHNFIAQTGDPTGTGKHGESVYSKVYGEEAKYYEAEQIPKLKHTKAGLLSMVGCGNNMLGSQFFITLGDGLQSLDAEHCVFGEITEGFEILLKLNEAICDTDHRPYRDIRITHTIILEDPFDDPSGLPVPGTSPLPSDEILANGRIAADEEIDETRGKSVAEVEEIKKEREAKAQATILEIVGDIPDADIAPPENVLFVCKLNPVTNDDDLEIIFSRFGKIKSCEVIRDKKTGESLQYAFIEFEEKKSCEDAYFKMDNVLIDDRRIHVDFSQSVAKLRWKGKGRGVEYIDAPSRSSTENMNSKMKKQEKLKNGDDIWESNNLHGSRSSSYTNLRSSSFDKRDDKNSIRDRRRRDSSERDRRYDRNDSRKTQDRSKREDYDRNRDGSSRRNDKDSDRRRTDKRLEDPDRERSNDRKRRDSNHDNKLKHDRKNEDANHDRYHTSKSNSDLREKNKSNRKYDEPEPEWSSSNRTCDASSETLSKYRKDKDLKEVTDKSSKGYSRNSESYYKKLDDDCNKKQFDLKSANHSREKVERKDMNCKSELKECGKTENSQHERKHEQKESEKVKKLAEVREEQMPSSSKDYLLSKKRKHSDSHEKEISKFNKTNSREVLGNAFSDNEKTNVENNRKLSNTNKEMPIEDVSKVIDSKSNNNNSRHRKSSSIDNEKQITNEASEKTIIKEKQKKLSEKDAKNDSKVSKSGKKENSSDECDEDSDDEKKVVRNNQNADNDNGKEVIKSKTIESKKMLKELNSKSTKKRKHDDNELYVKKKKRRKSSSSSSSGSEMSDSEVSSSDSDSSSSDYVRTKSKKHSKKRMSIPKKLRKKKKLKHEKVKKRVRHKSPSSESDSSSSDSSYDEKRHKRIRKRRKKHKSDSSSDDSSLDRMTKHKKEKKKKSKQKRKTSVNSDSDDSTSSSESTNYVYKKRPKKTVNKKVHKSKKQLNKKKKSMSKRKAQKCNSDSSSESSEDGNIKNNISKKISNTQEKKVNKKTNSASDSSD